jgi:AcrR family transcriptional regulator
MTKDTSRHREPLSRPRIIAAAAALLDREGPSALSARRLAAELGCEAMSLYHHVPNMGELLEAVIDDALAGIALPAVEANTPRRSLSALARDYLALALARPQVFLVLGTRRWRSPAQAALQSRMIELLAAHGLTARAALRASRILLVYLNGAGLAIAGWAVDPEPVAREHVTPVVRRLLRSTSRKQLTADLQAGLDGLIETVLRS